MRVAPRRYTALMAALLGTLTAAVPLLGQADDIDIYSANKYGLKPNVLFVLDVSGSMGWSLDGSLHDTHPAGGSDEIRIDVLRKAVNDLIDANVGKINAGVSVFADESSGILWPVSDLTQQANAVDPTIPPGLSSAEVLKKIVNSYDPDGATSTVDALVEAAQYFSEGTVLNGRLDLANLAYHTPPRWDTAINNFVYQDRWNNYVESRAANRASYSPSGEYNAATGTYYFPTSWDTLTGANKAKVGAYEAMWFHNSEIDRCEDRSESGGNNYCIGRAVQGCDLIPAEVVEEVDPETGLVISTTEVSPAYNDCWYYINQDFNANYDSPIEHSCQANYIVMVSDGQPTRRNAQLAEQYLGFTPDNCEDISAGFDAEFQGMGNCGKEVVEKLTGVSQVPDIEESFVGTHAVGFLIDDTGANYLRDMVAPAEEGGDSHYHTASDQATLNQTLNALVGDFIASNESFSEFAVDIDRAGFSHDDKAYIPLFQPTGTVGWTGNLKGYYLTSNGFMDTNGNPATELTDSGVIFSDTAQSFWSATPDGNLTAKGGANEQIVASGARRLYTWTDSGAPMDEALVGVVANRLSSDNSAITDTLLGLPSGSSLRAPALDWLQQAPMGAPLHSSPVSVQYDGRKVVYVMTNMGLIHAIDATTPNDPAVVDHSGGEEIFAFMPQELLSIIPKKSNHVAASEYIYGLDGQLTRWHDDTNHDRIVNNGERVILVFGMRRGGASYHALDVSDPESPRYLWRISQGDPGFEKLGESWSRASLISVKRNGEVKERVLAFAGGYDAATLDDQAHQRIASKGAAIYMVDRNGQLVWHVDADDNPNMQFAIPSDLTSVDSDRDGFVDRLYVGDVGGQIWRVDIDNIDDTGTTHVTRLADLGAGNPMYQPNTVAFVSSANGDYFAVAAGTGDRTDPTNVTSNNHLVMIRDTDVDQGAPAAGFTTATLTSLFDATDNSIGSDNPVTAKNARETLLSARGWRLRLQPGEKAVTKMVAYENRLMATTFHPDDPDAELSCGYTTLNRFWAIDLNDATPMPLSSYTDTGLADRDGSFTKVQDSLMSSGPTIVTPKDGNEQMVLVNRQLVGMVGTHLKQVYWYAK